MLNHPQLQNIMMVDPITKHIAAAIWLLNVSRPVSTSRRMLPASQKYEYIAAHDLHFSRVGATVPPVRCAFAPAAAIRTAPARNNGI